MSTWKLVTPPPAPKPAAASAARLESNRENARHSTGPKTHEGKTRSAQNALTHGLTSREVVVRPDERAVFDDVLAGLRDELTPCGPLEETIFAQIVHAAWNLRRVRILEAEMIDGQTDSLASDQNEAKLDRLSRYAQRFERSFYRATSELRKLQTERAAHRMLAQPALDDLPRLASVRQLESAKRTRACASTEAVRAALAVTDLEIAEYTGRVPLSTVVPIPRAPREQHA